MSFLSSNPKCIFSCSGKDCKNDSTETFKKIICPKHLSQVFGLKVNVTTFCSPYEMTLVGPYLIVDDYLQFNAKTVIFPERDYIDQKFLVSTSNTDYYDFILNPRMEEYINNLIQNKTNMSKHEIRYQLEIIRNLFSSDGNIKLAKESEPSHQQMHTTVSTRIHEMNQIIKKDINEDLIKKLQYLSTNNEQFKSVCDLTPFMQFILFNCLFDNHKLPQSNTGIGLTLYANLVYKPTIGFITTTTITHPSHLVLCGSVTGDNAYYQSKITKRYNEYKTPKNIDMKDLADNRRISNVISTNSLIC